MSNKEFIKTVKKWKKLCPLCKESPMLFNQGTDCPFPNYLYCPACKKAIGLDKIDWRKCFGIPETEKICT